MRKLLVALATLAVLGCPGMQLGTKAAVGVGGQVDLASVMAQALSCDPSSITWSVLEVGGGTISSTGLYTAPSCGAPGVAVGGTYHVVASGCSKTASVGVVVSEDVDRVVVCGIPAGGTLCLESVPVAVAGTATFYSRVYFQCGDSGWSPPGPPPGL